MTYPVALRRLGIALVLLVGGCSPSKPYSIFDKGDSSEMKSVYVEVPASATRVQLEEWAKELESSEKVEGKKFIINFYTGGHTPKDRLGNYRNGRLFLIGEKG